MKFFFSLTRFWCSWEWKNEYRTDDIENRQRWYLTGGGEIRIFLWVENENDYVSDCGLASIVWKKNRWYVYLIRQLNKRETFFICVDMMKKKKRYVTSIQLNLWWKTMHKASYLRFSLFVIEIRTNWNTSSFVSWHLDQLQLIFCR